MSDYQELVQRCSEEMRHQGMTQRELAKLANLSEATVSRVLSGTSSGSSFATLQAICDVLFVREPSIDDEVINLYKARVDDLNRRIAEMQKWLRIVAVMVTALVSIFVLFTIIDFLNPVVGWMHQGG